MRILTNDNSSFDINDLPEEVDDLRFCVFDNSDPAEADYYFVPLVFLESFMSPALVLKIGNQEITMPVDWQVLIGEPEHGDLEVVPLTSINDRGFSGGGMEIGVGVLLLLQFANLDNTLRPFVEESKDLIIDPIDFFPIVGKVSGHERTPSTRTS